MPPVPTADQFEDASGQLARFADEVGARISLIHGGTQRLATATSEVPGWWTGPRANATTAEIDDFVGLLDATTAPLKSIVGRARWLSGRASDHAITARVLEDRRFAAQLDLGPDPFGTVQLPNERQEALARLRAVEREIDTLELDWSEGTSGAARFINDMLASFAHVTSTGISTRRMGFGGNTAMLALLARLAPGLHPPSTDRSPDEVAAWWNSLDNSERRAAITLMPGVFGNLDGIPFNDRADANRLYFNGLLTAEGTGGPIHDRLADFLVDGQLDRFRQIVAFDLVGDGRVAELFGDIGSASSVTVIVPGMGSTLANFTSNVARETRKLWRHGGRTGAVIAWTGYDAPAGLERGFSAIEVASTRQAEAGGRALRSFVDGLHTQTAAPLTLIGHSYGSVAVGQALLGSARVTNAVFIGSPGVGVDHVDDFPAGAAERFYAGEVKGDPVAALQHFGDEPTDPDFGAYVFDAGPGNAINPMSRHSEYFDDGAAIDNLVAITRGQQPTPGSTGTIEHLLEFDEYLADTLDNTTDFLQDNIHVPIVDAPIDSMIDAQQSVIESGRNLVGTAVETGGHLAEDAADKVTDGLGWLAGKVTGR